MSLEIAKPEVATYFIARNADGSVLHTGEVTPDLVVTTGQPVLESETTENAVLQKLSAYPDKFPDLPERGELVEAGQIYNDDGTLALCRQSHNRTEHPIADIPNLFVIHRVEGDGYLDWIPGEDLKKGKIRRYNGQLWIVIQPLLTVIGQTPDIVPAHYQPYVPTGGDAWVDSGATFQGILAAGVFNVSDTSPFGAGQSIRIGSVETTVTSIWTPGAPGVLQFPVGQTTALQAVANGTMIEIWQ